MFDEVYRLKQDKKWLEEDNASLKHTLDSLVGVHLGWFIIETPCCPCNLKCYNPKFKVDNAAWRYHKTIESAKACIEKHSNNAPLTPPKATKDNEMIKQLKLSRDTNGNKTIKVMCTNGSFSIQTLGNLPLTHREGVTADSVSEVVDYVAAFGTARQINLIKYKLTK